MRLDARILCAVVTSFGLALAGCGDSSDDKPNTPPAPGTSQNFESLDAGTVFQTLAWAPEKASAVVAADPVVSTKKALKVTATDYNSGVVVKLKLPDGKKLSDYASVDLKAYFQYVDGGLNDLGSKRWLVIAWGTEPTGQFANSGYEVAGVDRAGDEANHFASTEWESLSLPIAFNAEDAVSADLTGEIYFAFGSNNFGCTYYIDDINLVAK